jgi:hypothetical protein
MPLFNPRLDNWDNHFSLEKGIIRGNTNIGFSTIKLLKLNSESRIEERIEIDKGKI